MKDNKTKVITIAALVIAVIGLSIGFAAFASTLNIQTGATVTPNDTFSVKFASGITGANGEFTEFQVTPTVAVTSTSDNGAIAGTPSIDNSDVKNPSIGNLSASFTRPGQSVTYTFYVVNDGNYDAYLTNLVFNNATGASSFKDCVSDSLSSNPATQSLVNSVCNNISFTMSVGDDSNITNSTRLNNHLLTRNHYETVIVTIAYEGSSYADGALKVNFGDIDLNYRTIDEPEEVATQDTPATSEEVAVDALIPTGDQKTAAYKDGEYSFGYIDADNYLKYIESENFGYVDLIYNGEIYRWACNDDTANLLSIEAKKWYIFKKNENSYTPYTLSSPINYETFNVQNSDVLAYVTRVINSFGS